MLIACVSWKSLPIPIDLLSAENERKMFLSGICNFTCRDHFAAPWPTREVDTNDGDVPSDDLIPAKSQTSRVKSGDVSRGLRQFTRSARKQDLDRVLVAAIVSKQV